MTDERSPNSDSAPGEDELLISALQVPSLSEDALERVRAAVEREWLAATVAGAATGSQRTALSSRLRWFGVAAAVAVAVGVTSWLAGPPAPTQLVGSVSRTDEGALSVQSAHLPRRDRAQGGELRGKYEITKLNKN